MSLIVVNSSLIALNRPKMPHNASNRPNSPQIQFKSTQIASKLLILISNLQNFIPKLQRVPSIFLPGHKFNANYHNTSLNRLQTFLVRPQSLSLVSKHHKMSPNMQNIAFNLFGDIIECLDLHSLAPKSAPNITKWSPIIKNVL